MCEILHAKTRKTNLSQFKESVMTIIKNSLRFIRNGACHYQSLIMKIEFCWILAQWFMSFANLSIHQSMLCSSKRLNCINKYIENNNNNNHSDKNYMNWWPRTILSVSRKLFKKFFYNVFIESIIVKNHLKIYFWS